MGEEDGPEGEVAEEDAEAGGDGDGDEPDVLHQLELDHLLLLHRRDRGAGYLSWEPPYCVTSHGDNHNIKSESKNNIEWNT